MKNNKVITKFIDRLIVSTCYDDSEVKRIIKFNIIDNLLKNHTQFNGE